MRPKKLTAKQYGVLHTPGKFSEEKFVAKSKYAGKNLRVFKLDAVSCEEFGVKQGYYLAVDENCEGLWDPFENGWGGLYIFRLKRQAQQTADIINSRQKAR